jgi:peptidoglycan/xylan/chitin deacetylase (PgdA/CDA1 family)
MSAHDHRIHGTSIAGALVGAATIGYVLPALAGSRPGLFASSPAPISPRLRTLLGVEDTTASGRGYALTFDDGPHPQGTPAVLEILARERVHATFFLVGEQVLRSPALAREIADAGHAIALHCHRHRNLLRLAPRQVREDIARAEEAIAVHSGRVPELYRPPYGVLNAAALRLAGARGWRTLLWSHWGRDWEARATADSIAARVTDGADEGAVLLLHDADDYSAPCSPRSPSAGSRPRCPDGRFVRPAARVRLPDALARPAARVRRLSPLRRRITSTACPPWLRSTRAALLRRLPPRRRCRACTSAPAGGSRH